jgi:hypothetical protein
MAWSVAWPVVIAFLRGASPYPGQVEADPVQDLLAADAVLPGARPQPPAVRLDQPALISSGGPPAPALMWDAGAAQVMIRFRDGTWRQCRVTGREKCGDGSWLMELRWGVAGRIYQARYVYDPGSVSPANGGSARNP